MPETTTGTAHPDQHPVDERVTMPLLTLITRQSLDEDYLVVAERKAHQQRPPTPGVSDTASGPGSGAREHGDRSPRPGWARHRAAAVVIALFGVLIATSAVQTARNSSVSDASRASLIERITSARGAVLTLQDQIVRLRGESATLQTSRADLVDQAQAVNDRLPRLRAGFTAAHGPGVQFTVADAPGDSNDARVNYLDLAGLVDGLWIAGAEAIAVNGQRLTSVSAIRNSGVVVRVNRTNLSSPYVVSAIGDTRTLQANFYETSAGLRFQQTAESVGFAVAVENMRQVTLPAAPEQLLRLRYAAEATANDKPPVGQEDGS